MVSKLTDQFILIRYFNHLEFKVDGLIITTTPDDINLSGNDVSEPATPLLMGYFKDWMNYTQLVDLAALDNVFNTARWEIVYNLLSIKDESRLRLRLLLRTLYTPSIQNIYPNSNWLEREVFDLYGILFLNHPDLRRILTDYGFEFYPLRKDFPLSGYTEVRFDEELGQMVTEPVNLSQDFRVYNFLNPWEIRSR
jgi:NADH:ubiquinone oxidoreductase subunit C